MKLQKLYRPTGIKELELIAAAGWKYYPPRLDWQPIFYPVLNEQYACQIAREWNTGDEFSGYCGIVTSFDIDEAYVSKYTVQNVGSAMHEELWVPAEELEVFNSHIAGAIKVVKVFFGDKFVVPDNKEIAELLLKFQEDDV